MGGHVVIEIEFYQGDIRLYGKAFSYRELRAQIDRVEELYDRENDNFAALLCRLYGWVETDISDVPEYIYDRDTGKLLKIKGGIECEAIIASDSGIQGMAGGKVSGTESP